MSLERAFADGPAFIPYIAAGDPTPEATVAYVEALVDGGADAIELGLPFSEPIAEGSTIQSAIVRSLAAGMTPERFFELVADLDVDVPIVVMTYYNLIYQYTVPTGGDGAAVEPAAASESGDIAGNPVEPFVRRAAGVGIDGIIVPDLPVDESDPLKRACDTHGLDLVFIVAPTTTDDRLARIMDRVSGYVYVQARLGTTGARDDVSDRTAESLARLTNYDVPTAVGFGIKEGDHAARIISAGADGVIVGSAIVDIIADGVANDESVATVAGRIERTARELKQGALRGAEGTDRTAAGPDSQ